MEKVTYLRETHAIGKSVLSGKKGNLSKGVLKRLHFVSRHHNIDEGETQYSNISGNRHFVDSNIG